MSLLIRFPLGREPARDGQRALHSALHSIWQTSASLEGNSGAIARAVSANRHLAGLRLTCPTDGFSVCRSLAG